MKNKYYLYLTFICLLLFFVACSKKNKKRTSKSQNILQKKSTKKVLYVNSYHKGYEWSDNITKTVIDIFFKYLTHSGHKNCNINFKVDLKIEYMDTKLNKSEEFKKLGAVKIKKVIDAWKPDIILTSDDNAVKYLVIPYLKGLKTPVVCSGINQNASMYGIPSENIVAMEEVFLLNHAINLIKPYAKGIRISAIASDTISEHKNIENAKEKFGITFIPYYVNTFANLKKAYINAQKNSDIVFLFECLSVKAFSNDDFKKFITNNISKPSASLYSFLNQYVVLSCSIIASEQGEWMANTALDILSGKDIKDIPLAKNHESVTYLNMTLANKLDIVFPIQLIKSSIFVK